MMPEKPASMVPKPNTIMNSRSILTAERRDHPRIARPCPHQHADAGIGHEQIKSGGNAEARSDDDNPPHRIEHAGISRTAPLKISGTGSDNGAAPPQFANAVIEKQYNTESRHQLIEMIAAVEMAKHQEFEQQAKGERRQ